MRMLDDEGLDTTFSAQLEQEILNLQEMDGDCDQLAALEDFLFNQDVDDAFAHQVTQLQVDQYVLHMLEPREGHSSRDAVIDEGLIGSPSGSDTDTILQTESNILADREEALEYEGEEEVVEQPAAATCASGSNGPPAAIRKRKAAPSHGFKGIILNINTKLWEANVWDPSKQVPERRKKGYQWYLGQFRSAEEAARTHDKGFIKLGRHLGSRGVRLNFPIETYEGDMAEQQHWSVRDYFWMLRRTGVGFTSGKSPMKGVSRKQERFEARCAFKDEASGVKMELYLGLFSEEEEAGRHYDKAVLFFKGDVAITNFMPGSYPDAEVAAYGHMLQEKMPKNKGIITVPIPSCRRSNKRCRTKTDS